MLTRLKTLEELVREAQLGDEDAFAELVARHYTSVHGIILATLGNWSSSEDVAQEVFLTVWRNLDSLNSPKSFPFWIRRIARNAAISCIRKEQVLKRVKEKHEMNRQDTTFESIDPAALEARKEACHTLHVAMENLSPKLREALALFYLEGLTTAESAEALGVKHDTFKKRVTLGRKRLKGYYGTQDINEIDSLLPYSPKPPVGRVMAGLALAPAVPGLGQAVEVSKKSLVSDHLRYGGSLDSLHQAGIASVPQSVGAVIAVFVAGFVALVSIATLSDSKPTPAPSAPPPVSETSADSFYIGMGAFTTDEWGADETDHHILVRKIFPNSPAENGGLKVGDHITHAGGLRVHPDGHPTRSHWLHGEYNETIVVTVSRPHESGHPNTLTLEIILDKIPPQFLREARAEFNRKP